MMQMPLSSYPQFSQFLQLHQLHQQRFSRTYPTPSPEIGMPSSRRSGGTSCSEASTGTPSSSPSPPLSIIENFPANGPAAASGKSAKSFTIDAILGIRDREIQDKMNGDHLNAIPGNFHPRLGLHLTGSHVENYQNSLDLSNATLEIGTRIDIARFSASSRELLGFQLPTDLTTTSDEINRRNLQNQISSYQNSSSCGGSSAGGEGILMDTWRPAPNPDVDRRLPPEKSRSDMSKKCGGKSKRVRTIFTPEQLERLEAEFERQQYMVGPERLYLAHTLQLTEAQVKVWFQNRRIKWRKQHLEIQQQRLAAIKQQNQRGEMDETDDEESGDSNNYSFTADGHADNSTTGTFFKSVEPDADPDLGQQFQRNKIAVTPPSSLSYRDNPGDNTNKSESNVENA